MSGVQFMVSPQLPKALQSEGLGSSNQSGALRYSGVSVR